MAVEKRKCESSPTGYAYRVRYPDPFNPGQLLSRTFDNHGDAETFNAQWKVEKRKGSLALLDAGKERLGDYILDDWGKAWGRAPGRGLQDQKTRKTRREVLKLIDAHILRANDDGVWGRDAIAHLQLRQVDARVIERYLWELQDRDVGHESIRKVLGILQQVFDRAIAHGRYPRPVNPVKMVEKPKANPPRRPKVFGPDVVERMRAYFLHAEDRLSATLVSTLAYSGVRPGEALALRVADFSGGRLNVARRNSLGEILEGTKSTKRLRRSVALPAVLVEDLETWIEKEGLPQASPLFPMSDGRYWSETAYRNWRRRVYRPAAEAAGLTADADNPYDLRHVYVSLRYAAGHSPIEVAAAAGHAPSLSTDYYADVIASYEGRGPVDWEAEIAAARAKYNGAGPTR